MPATANPETIGAAPGQPAELRLLTRVGCHLCEQAEQVVAQAAARHGAGVQVLDVDADEALRERYTNHVPVLFVGDELLDYWVVDADRLERVLEGERVAPPAPL